MNVCVAFAAATAMAGVLLQAVNQTTAGIVTNVGMFSSLDPGAAEGAAENKGGYRKVHPILTTVPPTVDIWLWLKHMCQNVTLVHATKESLRGGW